MGFAHEDAVMAVHRNGSKNLERIVSKLCKLQDKRLARAEANVHSIARKKTARFIATSLDLGAPTVIAEEDVQLMAKLSKCMADCNSRLDTCLRTVESCQEAPVRKHQAITNLDVSAAVCADAMGTQVASS